MSIIKKCTKCGTDNDIIFTNCQSCRSPLAWTDANTISNEELIFNTGAWIKKVGASHSASSKNANAIKSKALRTHESSKIEGFALKYLSLLKMRVADNASLKITYDSLKKDFESRNNPIHLKTGISKMIVMLVISAFALLLLYYVIH